jgi:hypothetical protein
LSSSPFKKCELHGGETSRLLLILKEQFGVDFGAWCILTLERE